MHKFNNINEDKKEKLKFGSIIDQTGKYTYNAAQAISKYLKPLGRNEYTVDNTYIFSKHIKDLPPLQEDEEYVSYVESLFTNIPINETIEYILDYTYNKERLKPICSKLIFRRLMKKLATEVTSTLYKIFYKQLFAQWV